MAICSATVPDKDASGDNFYGASICDQVYVDFFWNTYGFAGNKDYWDGGFGWEDACNTDLPLARTFNACYALTYSAENWENDDYSGAMLNWARRYVRDEIDNLRSLCGDGSAIARSFGNGTVEVYTGFWFSKDVPGRVETLVHESRHEGGKPHNANFPAGSVFGAGGSGADSDWAYEGAWMYGALYLWWYFAQGARTTAALRERARQRGNLVIDNAFATHPGFNI